MKSIMDADETYRNQIVKAHENGDRQVSYDITGDRSLSLEEDLKGLDKAYELCMNDLEVYIMVQQTNKAFEHPQGGTDWFFKHSQGQSNINDATENYNYFDDDYSQTAISMMEEAKTQFLTLFRSPNYKQGIGAGIITKIMNSNTDFMKKTALLYEK